MKPPSSKSSLATRIRGRGLNKDKLFLILKKYGTLGVKALEEGTPKETGETAASWTFTVSKDLVLTFKNNETTEQGVPIPILLMYGYTRGSTLIEPNDFVRRALEPIIRSMKDEIRKELL